jgi:hypothetical protein
MAKCIVVMAASSATATSSHQQRGHLEKILDRTAGSWLSLRLRNTNSRIANPVHLLRNHSRI